jgi:hypothetical protein
VDEEREAARLRERQLERESAEAELARGAGDAEDTAQHERRAAKAAYLREKLEERERSERD